MFGFDPLSLTEEALMERISEINRKIVFASKFTSGGSVAALQSQRIQCENALREKRMAPMMAARKSSAGIVVESDPELAAQHKAAKEAEAAKLKQSPNKPFNGVPRDLERIRPTATPVIPKSNTPR